MEDIAIELALLLIRKMEIEKKMRKTVRCFLRRCFSCLGMKNIEEELKMINDKLFDLKLPKMEPSRKLKRISSL